MGRFVVTLAEEDYQRLAQLAKNERREVPEQGALLIEKQIRRLAKNEKEPAHV